MTKSAAWLPLAALIALLALAAASYWPGLSGGFLFDDFTNLNALGARGPIDNLAALARYLTSGTADPIGRPLSLLSFLVDARDWPADPAPFLRSNLLLHLLNGALLFCLLRRLGDALAPRSVRSEATALLATGLWLLHPLFVSTTLYIVQREAMLPATFTLLGLWLFVDGRLRFQAGDYAGGRWRMIVGVAGGTALAALSKANGVLLPLLALTLVATVFRSTDAASASPGATPRHLDRWLLWLPSAVVLLYLLRLLPQWSAPLEYRPWTIGQRFLTEPRVLLDYLGLLLAPRAMSTGLFNDEYPVATGWLHPAATLPSLLLVAVLVGLAWHWRRTYPRLAAALLFFFAGHSLESSLVPLEIYFEHRNYLPALLLFWPVAGAVVHWRAAWPWRALAATLMLALCAATTASRASLWGDQERLTLAWGMRNPDSPRAIASAASMLIASGQAQQAADVIAPLWRQRPGEVQLAFNYVNARCAGPGIDPGDIHQVRETLARASGGQLLIHVWLGRALAAADGQQCPGLTLPVVADWVETARANPGLGSESRRAEDLAPLQGELAISRGDTDQAFDHFRSALDANFNPDFAARMVALAASRDQPELALRLLDYFERHPESSRAAHLGMPWLNERVMRAQGYWPRELAALRGKLEADIADRRPRADSALPPTAPGTAIPPSGPTPGSDEP